MFALTPNRMAVAEWALTSLDGMGWDADTSMAVIRTIDAYTYGTAHAEVALRLLMEGQGWSSGDEMRMERAPEMTWLMNTGRYPVFHRYLRAATRKDDPQWQFETGLDYVLDGIAVRMGI